MKSEKFQSNFMLGLLMSLCVLSLLAAHSLISAPLAHTYKQRTGGYVSGPVTVLHSDHAERERAEADFQFTVDVLSEWAIHNSPVNRRLSKKTATKIVKTAMYAAVDYGLDPTLVLALIKVESAFVLDAESSAGALGLTQIIPKWHPEKGVTEETAMDPVFNVRTGVRILAEYLGWHDGDLNKALLQYNGSLKNPESRYPVRVLTAQSELDRFLRERRSVWQAEKLSV